MGFNAELEVQTSREFRVAGAIGPVTSTKTAKASVVAETEIGEGLTCTWKLGSVDPSSTIALYFEVVNHHNSPVQAGKQRYLQLSTLYQCSNGQFRLRVTTTSNVYADPVAQVTEIANGFDQEAAAVIMARWVGLWAFVGFLCDGWTCGLCSDCGSLTYHTTRADCVFCALWGLCLSPLWLLYGMRCTKSDVQRMC
jgi:hypothetical protein